jgi:hypothetical protein
MDLRADLLDEVSRCVEFVSPGAEILNLVQLPLDVLVVAAVSVSRRLDGRHQAAFVIMMERKETERLLVPRQGAQHFCHAQHRSGAGQEH